MHRWRCLLKGASCGLQARGTRDERHRPDGGRELRPVGPCSRGVGHFYPDPRPLAWADLFDAYGVVETARLQHRFERNAGHQQRRAQ